jgi:hypothetical protein
MQSIGLIHQNGFLDDRARLRRIIAIAFAGHTRAALTAQLIAPSAVGVVLADPPDAEADGNTWGSRRAPVIRLLLVVEVPPVPSGIDRCGYAFARHMQNRTTISSVGIAPRACSGHEPQR